MLNDMLDIIDVENNETGGEDRVGGFDLVYRDGFIKKNENCVYTSYLGSDIKRTSKRPHLRDPSTSYEGIISYERLTTTIQFPRSSSLLPNGDHVIAHTLQKKGRGRTFLCNIAAIHSIVLSWTSMKQHTKKKSRSHPTKRFQVVALLLRTRSAHIEVRDTVHRPAARSDRGAMRRMILCTHPHSLRLPDAACANTASRAAMPHSRPSTATQSCARMHATHWIESNEQRPLHRVTPGGHSADSVAVVGWRKFNLRACSYSSVRTA